MRESSASIELWRPTFGAVVEDGATTFSVWATAAERLALVLEDQRGKVLREVPCERETDDGMFRATVKGVGPGARYAYRLNGQKPFPDPASRFQPDGVHGPSQVVDWTRFRWTDENWSGVPFDRLVIYEIHVGTFTPQGTFAGVAERLPYLVDLGVTAIELMPIAAFPGRRNWGYDGVALYAPATAYGTPEDLQRLVNAAHDAGIAVLLDVVYNHLGPDGAYLAAFSPQFFTAKHQSPWGDGVNLDGEGSRHVRRFLIENALHWVHEYHMDGLRLDATHALIDDSRTHFLAELADAVHGIDVGRPVHVIAEDERNLSQLMRARRAGGFGLDGVWADDFHHEMHRLLTGENESYYCDFAGEPKDVATTINQGWIYTGQVTPSKGEPRGSEPSGIRRRQLIFCLQNHDQVGNRAIGERASQLSELASCRAAAAVLLLAPETPLVFMGEEWAASTPFLYFTDHHEELGRLVTEGRRKEFASFSAFTDPATRSRIPDPQADSTFEASRIQWLEPTREPHASMRRLYRALIALRTETIDDDDNNRAVAHTLDADTIAVVRHARQGRLLLVARFRTPGTVRLPEHLLPESRDFLLTTEDPSFAPDAVRPTAHRTDRTFTITFARPSAAVIRI